MKEAWTKKLDFVGWRKPGDARKSQLGGWGSKGALVVEEEEQTGGSAEGPGTVRPSAEEEGRGMYCLRGAGVSMGAEALVWRPESKHPLAPFTGA